MDKKPNEKIIYSDIEYDDNYDIDSVRDYLDTVIDSEIVAIAVVDRWNGRFTGYKLCGKNIRGIFSTGSDCGKWYGEDNDIKAILPHHDGTNTAVFRVFKKNISEKKKQEFLDKIYNQKLEEDDIKNITKSLYPYVKKIYGW